MDFAWRGGDALLERGTLVAGYRVESILGHGGMGVVYEATQLSLERTVALKLLASKLSEDDVFRERFRREGMLQASLDHPHIVAVHEAGESEHGLFLAMRLIRGPRLKEMIISGELDPSRTLRLLAQVADALDAAHEAGLIHRDVKPQNVLVGTRDHAYLADFGLTKVPGEKSLTGTGQFLGTLDYVAPEQIVGEPATARSDVYALTAALYECLTGVTPFPRESDAAILYGHLNEAPPRATDTAPELPQAVDGVIERGLAKEPCDRPASAGELLEEAGRALGAVASGAPPRTASGGATLARRRRFRRIGRPLALALLTAAVAGGVAGALVGGSDSEAQAEVVRAGPIALTPPEGWRPVADRGLPGFGGPDSVAVAPPEGPAGAVLVAAPLSNVAPNLLPKPLVARLPRNPVVADVVRLGSVDAQRYRRLAPPPGKRVGTVYVVPTATGVAALVCAAPAAAAARFLQRCEIAAASLRLDGARARALRPSRRYARRLVGAVQRLNSRRAVGRRTLARRLGNPVVQASAARMVAAALDGAIDALATVRPPAAVARAHGDLRRALRLGRDGYRAMAVALAAGDSAGYGRARSQVSRGEVAIQVAFEWLRPLGYTVE